MLWHKNLGLVSICSLDTGGCILRIEFKVYRNLMKLIHLNVEGSLLDVGERPSLLNYNPVNDFEAMAIESHFLSFAKTDKEELEIANKKAEAEAEAMRGKVVEEVFLAGILEEYYEDIISIAERKQATKISVLLEALGKGLDLMEKEGGE